MALHKHDIFGFRLETLHRNLDTSWRFSVGRMRGILAPAVSAVNKNNNKNPDALFKPPGRYSLQLPSASAYFRDVGVGVFTSGASLRHLPGRRLRQRLRPMRRYIAESGQ